MEIRIEDAKEVYTTTSEEDVNEKLNDGWTLIDVTRGNLKYLFLLVRI